MSQQPCRQLNSVAIRDEVLASIIPIVRTSCSILGVKCVWRVQGGVTGIQAAWNNIVDKRNECDAVITKTPGVGFFFSAISTYQSSKKKPTREEEEQEPSDDDQDGGEDDVRLSQLSTTNSSEVPLAISKCAKNKTHPAITYWVAIQSANGAPVDALILHSALVHCDVEVNSTRASSRKGGCEILNKVCQLLKDHKNDFMADIITYSYKRCRDDLYEEITGETLGDKPLVKWEQVVRLVIVREELFPSLNGSVARLKDVGLHFDVYNTKSGAVVSRTRSDPPKQLGEPLTILCNDIERALVKLNYAYREGYVFKKQAESHFTYGRLCSMESFLNSLLGNASFKDRLLRYMSKLQAILRHPDCQAIAQIEIDRDLVEVKEGWCWCFQRRQFVEHAVKQSEIGRKSPRAFIPYDHDQVPDPKFFEGIMTNSLSEGQMASLCEDFLRLFECQSREHKEKVPCLIGPSNSGKTSLLMATTRIIDHAKVARVTKQREFNKAMIDEDTELINLDEATVGLMDVDDWKIITQGGWTALDRKWKTAKGFLNRAPIFITCQKQLDFGSVEDNVAMNNRLNMYHFKPLPLVNKNAAKWIKDHPMDCIVWAAAQCSSPASQVQEENGEIGLEFTGLTKEDKDAIITLNLESEITITNTDAPEHSETQRPSRHSEDDDNDEILDSLERALDECLANLGKASMIRGLKRLRKNENKESRQRLYDREVRLYRQRQEALRKIGVDEDLLDLLPQDSDDVIPTQLQQQIDERHAELQKINEEKENARVKDIFRSVWLSTKEKEMAHLQLQIINCPRGSVKKAKEYLLTTCVDALRAYHANHKTPAAIGLEYRRKKCIELGLLKASHARSITTLHEPLPWDQDNMYSEDSEDSSEWEAEQEVNDKEKEERDEGKEKDVEEEEEEGDNDEEDDDNEIFMTPLGNNNSKKHKQDEVQDPLSKKHKSVIPDYFEL